MADEAYSVPPCNWVRETGGGEQIILEKVPDLNRFVFRASNSVMQALDEQPAEYVVTKFTSATKTLAELKPEVGLYRGEIRADPVLEGGPSFAHGVNKPTPANRMRGAGHPLPFVGSRALPAVQFGPQGYPLDDPQQMRVRFPSAVCEYQAVARMPFVPCPQPLRQVVGDSDDPLLRILDLPAELL